MPRPRARLLRQHARRLVGLGALLGAAALLQRAALADPGRQVVHVGRGLAQRFGRAQLGLLHALFALPARSRAPGPSGGPHGLGRARRAHKGERRGWACSAVLRSLAARLSTTIILYAHGHQAPHLALFLTLSYILSLMKDKRS